MKGRILQRAELYLQKEGEQKARHVKHWPDYVKICNELGITTDYEKRTFLEKNAFPPEGKPITEWPEENGEKMFSWVKGLLTLHPRPSADEALDLGFNSILPFAGLVDDWQGKIIPSVGKFTDGDPRIVGHNISDEPDCRNDTAENVLNTYQEIRERDSNPIGCIFCGADIGCAVKPREYWLPVINKLDFVMLDVYPYNIHVSDPLKEMERCFNEEWQGVTVPILPIIQAHGSEHQNHRKPNALEQVKFWKDRGFGYIVYCWRDEHSGVSEYRDEWKEANKYENR